MSSLEGITEIKLNPQPERVSRIIYSILPNGLTLNSQMDKQNIGSLCPSQIDKIEEDSTNKESMTNFREEQTTIPLQKVFNQYENLPQKEQKKEVIELYAKKVHHRIKLEPIKPAVVITKKGFNSADVANLFDKYEHIKHIYTIGVQFLMEPIQQRAVLKFKVKMNRSLFGNTFSIIFEDNQKVVCSINKGCALFGSKYYLDAINQNGSIQPVGVLAKNFIGSRFKLAPTDSKYSSSPVQISYEVSCGGFGKGGRRMEVQSLYPPKDESFPAVEYTHKNKQPRYDETKKKYFMGFPKSIKKASVKNFVLMNNEGLKKTLVFGKEDTDSYILNIGYPLSPFQGIGIVLSSLAFKLGCK